MPIAGAIVCMHTLHVHAKFECELKDCSIYIKPGKYMYFVGCMYRVQCSLKFSRVKYVVLPNSAQKQIFSDKIFMV